MTRGSDGRRDGYRGAPVTGNALAGRTVKRNATGQTSRNARSPSAAWAGGGCGGPRLGALHNGDRWRSHLLQLRGRAARGLSCCWSRVHPVPTAYGRIRRRRGKTPQVTLVDAKQTRRDDVPSNAITRSPLGGRNVGRRCLSGTLARTRRGPNRDVCDKLQKVLIARHGYTSGGDTDWITTTYSIAAFQHDRRRARQQLSSFPDQPRNRFYKPGLWGRWRIRRRRKTRLPWNRRCQQLLACFVITPVGFRAACSPDVTELKQHAAPDWDRGGQPAKPQKTSSARYDDSGVRARSSKPEA